MYAGSGEFLKISLSPSSGVDDRCYQDNMAVSYAYVTVSFKGNRRDRFKPEKRMIVKKAKAERREKVKIQRNKTASHAESQNQMFRHRMNTSDTLTEFISLYSLCFYDIFET